MEIKRLVGELTIIFIAALIIALGITYPGRDLSTFLYALVAFLIILMINTLAKKFFAYNLETDVNVSFWSINHWGFKKSQKFKKPLPMAILPIITSLITRGILVWMPIIEFDVTSRPERVSRRHGLYRFTEVTEWHVALIATAGIFANIFFGVIGYFVGLENFARWSIFFALWSILPLSRLDGSKIFFGSRNLWFALLVIVLAIFLWGVSVI